MCKQRSRRSAKKPSQIPIGIDTIMKSCVSLEPTSLEGLYEEKERSAMSFAMTVRAKYSILLQRGPSCSQTNILSDSERTENTPDIQLLDQTLDALPKYLCTGKL